MKVARVEVSNFRKIEVVELNIDGASVELTGKNSQGKSSFLDAIWVALKGLSAKDPIRATPTMPINHGKEQAVIKITLKDGPIGLVVTRTFKRVTEGEPEFTSKLEVANLDGSVYKSPQKQLDAIIGEHRLDPIEFINLSAADQLEAFRVFVKDIDFAAIDKANDKDRETRTTIGREVKRLQAAALEYSNYGGDETPDAEVDVAQLTKELMAIRDANQAIDNRASAREQLQQTIDRSRADAAIVANEFDVYLKEVEIKRAEFKERISKLLAKATSDEEILASAPALPEKQDPSAVIKQIEDANGINANVRKKIEHRKLNEQAKEQLAKYDEVTKSITAREDDLEKQIKAAKLPLPELGFGKAGLLLNGVPFKESGTAEQIETAVALATSLNPKLELIWIRDASLLDDDTLGIVTAIAKKKDFTVLLETVRPLSQDAIVLENGRVKEVVTDVK